MPSGDRWTARVPRASRAAMRPVAFDVSMPTELSALLDAVKDSRYYPVLQLIAATGMRKGEALALSWKGHRPRCRGAQGRQPHWRVPMAL